MSSFTCMIYCGLPVCYKLQFCLWTGHFLQNISSRNIIEMCKGSPLSPRVEWDKSWKFGKSYCLYSNIFDFSHTRSCPSSSSFELLWLQSLGNPEIKWNNLEFERKKQNYYEIPIEIAVYSSINLYFSQMSILVFNWLTYHNFLCDQ